MSLWSFVTLAPGMDSHVDSIGDNSTETSTPQQQVPQNALTNSLFSSLRWVMRGHHNQTCSPTSIVSVDAKDSTDSTHAAMIAASLASPNRIVLRSSTHAFSARSALATGEQGNSTSSLTEQSCRILIQQLVPNATSGMDPLETLDADPCVLVGLSCPYKNQKGVQHETEEQYDNRTLSTPLLWEEPRSFLFDCRRSGLYLWSEEAGVFGRKVADRCLETPSMRQVSQMGTVAAQAELEIRWRDGDGSASVPSIELSVKGQLPHEQAKAVSNYTWDLPTGFTVSDLVPSVTFLTENCRAAVLLNDQ